MNDDKKDEFNIAILIDNSVGVSNLTAEHGLSMMIETGRERILFDCGKSSLILDNAKEMGISLSNLDALVLSHGHYDHCGGLMDIIKLNPGLKIYAHPSIFEEKYFKDERGLRYIGMPFKKKDYQDSGANFILSEKSMEIAPDIWTSGQIPRVTDFEDIEKGFIKKVEKGYVPDKILDDLSIIINSEHGTILLLGCTHSGIINTLKEAVSLSGEDKFLLIAGGMHLSSRSDSYSDRVLKEMSDYNIDSIMPLHCTGIKHLAAFNRYFGPRLVYGGAGKVMGI